MMEIPIINKSIRKEIEKCEFRQGYHIMPPSSWMNDPNGFIYYKGEYHLFYQYNPFEPEWGSIHWGHYKSKNLFDWVELPIAIAPDETYDRDGCFSGSALVVGDKLQLVYTGNIFSGEDKSNDLIQCQCLASSTDGIVFNKYEENPVIPTMEGIKHFRDPWIWKKNDLFYMALGTQSIDNLQGKAVLYKSTDLVNWESVGDISESNGHLGFMWECPSVFELGNKEVMIFSPLGMEKDGEKYHNLYQSGYFVGNIDYNTGEMCHGEFIELDRGFDFYAPQTLLDPNGRRIMIAWMGMWESEIPTKKNHWAGNMTLPREICIDPKGRIKSKPVKELQRLRYNLIRYQDIEVNGRSYIEGIEGKCIELIIDFDVESSQAEKFGVVLRASDDGSEETVVSYNRKNNQLVLDRNNAGLGPKGIRKLSFPNQLDKLNLHIFLDNSSIEVFINEGDYVMSARIYPKNDSVGVYFFGDGAINTDIKKWDLKKVMDK